MIANQTQSEPKRDTSFEPVSGKERKTIAAIVRTGTAEELENYLNIMLELRYCRGQRDGLDQGKQSGIAAIDSVFGTPSKDTLPDRIGAALDKLNAVLSGDLRAADSATKHETGKGAASLRGSSTEGVSARSAEEAAPKPTITSPEDAVDCRDTPIVKLGPGGDFTTEWHG